MKKLILLSILVCCQWAAQAQVFAPEGSKWWICRRQQLVFPPYMQDVHHEVVIYSGDTLINGLSYKKVGNQLRRVEGDTVFVFDGGQDYVLLNFSLEVGDTIRHLKDKTILYDQLGGSYMTFQVTEKGKIAVQNDSLRYQVLTAIHTDFPEWDFFPPPLGIAGAVLEKVGLGDFLFEITCPSCPPSNKFLLKYEYLDNTDYYFPDPSTTSCGWLDMEEQTIQTSVQVYPNPSTGVINIVWNGGQVMTSLRVLNSLGQEVLRSENHQGGNVGFDLSHLTTGMYYVEMVFEDQKRLVEKITLNR
jgi:hypothetical protein